MHSVYAIGNPLVDMVAYAGFDVLEALGATPGTMNLIDEEARGRLLATVPVTRTVPGGSAANTLRGLAWLAAGSIDPPLYAGAVGADDLGSRYERDLRALGVETELARKGEATGISTIIVTPDHERTMFTCLAACRGYGPEDCAAPFPACRWLYFTAYMWDTPNQRTAVMRRAAEAREAGVPVAFDVADPFAVGRYRDSLLEWIPGRVEVLFGNRQEIRLLVGGGVDDAELVSRAGTLAPVVVMKLGGDGCIVHDRGAVVASPARRVPVIDTIGAGDFFAAGFLYGLLQGRSCAESSRYANGMGAAVVGVEGCSLERIDRSLVFTAP